MSQFYQLFYHVVWGTKSRQPLINSAIEKLISEYLPSKIAELGGVKLAFNMTSDHIHLLVTIQPTISIADFLQKIKGGSSYHINVLMGKKDFYWQEGYGVLSLSKRDLPFIKKYVENQKIHHQDNRLIAVLEQTDVS